MKHYTYVFFDLDGTLKDPGEVVNLVLDPGFVSSD